MQFEHERYVRLYVRDTVTWTRLQWDGQACMTQLLRRADDRGGIELAGAQPWEAAVNLCGAPADVARRGVTKMLELGVVVHDGDRLVFPRYVAANKAPKSGAQRMRELRARKRLGSVAPSDETSRVTHGDARRDERDVTRDKTSPFRIGHELMFELTGRQYGREWREDLETIGAKPLAERRAVLAAIRADAWCKRNPLAVDPRHVAKHWARYAGGNPARVNGVNGSAAGRYAGPSRVATQAEYEADKTEKGPWET